MIGPIPREIAALGNLDILVLEKNKLTGTLPNTFNAGLNRLRLNLNFLSGTVPSTLSGRLISLDLTGNKFTGTLDDLIDSVPRMKQLELGDNLFTGTIPASLADLSSISEYGSLEVVVVVSFSLSLSDFTFLCLLVNYSNSRRKI